MKDFLGGLYFDCANLVLGGHVVQYDTSEKLVTGFLHGASVLPDTFGAHHIAGLDQLIFGFPVDGHFVADGTATMPGASAPVGMTYTLTRDVNFGKLTVNTGVIIVTNGYRLFANYLQLNGTAVLHNDGGSAGNASGTLGGSAGAAPGSGSISYAIAPGKTGGQGASNGKNEDGYPGGRGSALSPALGGAGGAGGAGTAGSGAGGRLPGGHAVATTVTAPLSSPYFYPKIFHLFDDASVRGLSGGAAGSPGGGGGSSSTPTAGDGGGGGGSGAGGGVCLIAAGILDTVSGSWTGRISANGGDGGNGAGPTPGGSNGGTGGLGGGGGGGAAFLVIRRLVGNVSTSTAPGSTPSACVTARAGINGASGDATGVTTAAPGIAYVFNLSQPYVQPNEFRAPIPVLMARPAYRMTSPARFLNAPSPRPTNQDAPPIPILSSRLPDARRRISPGALDGSKP